MTEDEPKKKEEQLEEIVTEKPEKTGEIKDQIPLDLAPARYGGPGKSLVPKRYQPDIVWHPPARYGGPGKSSVPARYR